MTPDRAYRILVAFDSHKKDFVARVPELDVEARGATRADAVAEIESAIEQRIAHASEQKQQLPHPVDADDANGELSINLGAPLHKELLFHARASRMRPEELAQQLLSRAIGSLDGGRWRSRRDNEARADDQGGDENRASRPSREGDRDRDDDRGNRRSRRPREGYRPELDDKANFLEYLRGLEKGGGPQGGGGRGRR